MPIRVFLCGLWNFSVFNELLLLIEDGDWGPLWKLPSRCKVIFLESVSWSVCFSAMFTLTPQELGANVISLRLTKGFPSCGCCLSLLCSVLNLKKAKRASLAFLLRTERLCQHMDEIYLCSSGVNKMI